MDVVMFGFNDWHQWESEGFRTRCGAVAYALAEHPSLHRLLVVSTPHSVGMNAMRAVRGRLTRSSDPRTTLRPFATTNVSSRVLTLEQTRLLPGKVVPPALYRANDAAHDRALRRAIMSTCKAHGMKDLVLWVADPLVAKHLGQMGESLSVFDAIDDWTAHPQKRAWGPWVKEGYDLVRDRADVVFTVSHALERRLGEGREGVHWQPNAVDAERFEGSFGVPDDLVKLRKPIIGYVGVIQERLDVELVAVLSRAIPDASIVLVGPVLAAPHVEPLRHLDNVWMLGERPASLVPAYLSAFDVCIMPHVDDALTRSMDPLKIYEYLAAGKPVVASGVAGMDVPPELMLSCQDHGAFVAGVRSTLNSRDSSAEVENRRARQEYARSRSWDSRLEQMLTIIGRAATERGMPAGVKPVQAGPPAPNSRG